MPNVKNSYPKRAYRRKQRAVVNARRIALAKRAYDAGYVYKQTSDGREYLIRTSYYERVKQAYKRQARRKARYAGYADYGRNGNYRKLFDLWWSIY